MTTTTTTYGGARIRYNSDPYEDYRGADADPTPADRARELAADLRRHGALNGQLAAAGRVLDDDVIDTRDCVTVGDYADAIDAAADAWDEANGLWAPEEDCDYDD